MTDRLVDAAPFVPARDFEVSKAFYRALGFECLTDGEVAIFRTGTSRFILQNYWQEGWAANFMMQLVVADLDGWWSRMTALDLPGRFGVQRPKPPVLQPWGLIVGYVYDPAGVLWHVTGERPA